jgi:hypothetical protein
VREHTVQLAGDLAALGDRRRAGLLIASVLELGEQQLGLVLGLPGLLDELRDDAEQNGHEHPSRDRGGGASGDRGDDTERDRHRATDRDSEPQRQPGDRDEHRDAGRDPGRSLELKPCDRDAGGADDRDHGGLELEAELEEAVADRDQEHRSEHAQRERHRQRLAVQSRDRMAVHAAEHHHQDHRPPERAQRSSLAMQALLSPGSSLRYPLAVRC